DPRRVMEVIEQRRKLDDKSSGNDTCVGLAYYRLGDWENALKYLKAAQEKSPQDEGAQYGLSMTYSRLGDTGHAREHFDRGEKTSSARRAWVEAEKDRVWGAFPIRGEAAALLGVHKFDSYLDRFFLARGYWEKGDKEQALKWYHDAARWLEKNDPK